MQEVTSMFKSPASELKNVEKNMEQTVQAKLLVDIIWPFMAEMFLDQT